MTSRLGVPLMPQESLSPPGMRLVRDGAFPKSIGTLEAKLPVMHSGLS